tara:strand:+ start:282 stop:476 length:195 start_codon:yes stop_codon:yes gene_type:complete
MTLVDSKPRTVPEAATELNVSQATIRAWIGQRKIGHLKLGRSVRIPADEIRRKLEHGYVPPAPE